jgi:hypothetical protein
MKKSNSPTAESEKLKEEFLKTIPEEEKDRLLLIAERASDSVESIWKMFGHTPLWVDMPTIDTGRTVNYPNDESVYSRRNAHCARCRFDMWLIVEASKIAVYGGSHQCAKE